MPPTHRPRTVFDAEHGKTAADPEQLGQLLPRVPLFGVRLEQDGARKIHLDLEVAGQSVDLLGVLIELGGVLATQRDGLVERCRLSQGVGNHPVR